MLANLIIVGVVISVVYAIRYSLWKEEIPTNITKYRWLIAIAITFVIMFITVAIQDNAGINSTKPGGDLIYLLLLYTISNALKNGKKEDKKEENEKQIRD